MTKPSELWPEEFYDMDKVLLHGAKKYGDNTWLNADAHLAHFSHQNNYASICRHQAKAYADPRILDAESKLNHHLHAACRHMMQYTRIKRNLDLGE